MKIEYVTSNQKKFEEAQHILSEWTLEQINIELTEIQGERSEIIKHKAFEAFNKLQKPLIVEDVSLCCPALNGLPGPYIKDFLIHLGSKGIAELIHKYEDHSVEAVCTVAYIELNAPLMIFEGILKGQIVAPRVDLKQGTMGWNPIFLPEGYQRTFGEMTLKERSAISMRYLALIQLKDYLDNKK